LATQEQLPPQARAPGQGCCPPFGIPFVIQLVECIRYEGEAALRFPGPPSGVGGELEDADVVGAG
jgi:hypothetical protein